MILKFELDGKSWDYDEESLTVEQALTIEKRIDGTLMDYEQGLSTGSTPCYQALGWLIFHGGDPDVAIESVSFPVLKLSAVYLRARMAEIDAAQAALDEAKAAAEADPTQPPASPPPAAARASGKTASTGTSRSSSPTG